MTQLFQFIVAHSEQSEYPHLLGGKPWSVEGDYGFQGAFDSLNLAVEFARECVEETPGSEVQLNA